MPIIKTTVPLIPWTKIPNRLLDQQLPTLKDTELRVLLVVLRKTVGFHKEHTTVLLTYRELMRLTGRRSEAISRALRSLRRQGLVHITQDDGP